jgi:hypothetical protein
VGNVASPLIIGDVPNNTESRVRIAAVNKMGDGAASNMKTATPVSKKSIVWETERRSNSSLLTTNNSPEFTVATMKDQLPPSPITVRTKSVGNGRRTQVTASRTASDVNIPVTHAIITVRLKNGKLLARIQVRLDSTNPTTSVTVPYQSSKVRITVQFANQVGVSAGGTPGTNIKEGSTFLPTTIDVKSASLEQQFQAQFPLRKVHCNYRKPQRLR